MMSYVQDTIDSISTIVFLTQLIILFRKIIFMQRNGLKLSQNVNIFLKKLNNMVLLYKIL